MAKDMTRRSRGRPRNEDEDSASADLLRDLARKRRLDRASTVPLWVQLKNALSDRVEDGGLKPDERLPSEQTICEIFDVSRPVVRSALAGLAADGLIIRVPRKGIFVSRSRNETNFLTSNVSVHSDLTARGHHVTARAFVFHRCSPDEAERRVFALPEDGTVVRVGRIYASDGQPITHTLIALPGHKMPDFEKIDIEGQSIFQILKENYGLVSQRAERWFNAALADETVAERLQVALNHPLIFIESIAYDTDDAPLEYYRAYYNADVARIHVSTGSINN